MKKENSEFDLDRMRFYMSLPAEKKFEYLEEANKFFAKFRNKETERIGKILKQKGF
jgi:hypothetical protein